MENMRPPYVQLLLPLSTLGVTNCSANPYISNNQKRLSHENMEYEAIFSNQTPLRDLYSNVQCEDEHYPFC